LYGELLHHTHHVIFLDTPHGGTNIDRDLWETVYGGAATAAAESQFGFLSSSLAETKTSFAEIAGGIMITSFHADENTVVGSSLYQVCSKYLKIRRERKGKEKTNRKRR